MLVYNANGIVMEISFVQRGNDDPFIDKVLSELYTYQKKRLPWQRHGKIFCFVEKKGF